MLIRPARPRRTTAPLADWKRVPPEESAMGKTRLEAFSDGVIAILITIMVLELKVPHGDGIDALQPLFPVFLSYVLSFLYVGIYWNNHHHMLHLCHKVTGPILWANLHLLFWLSLVPFATGWVGENHFASAPAALYGTVLLMAAIAYWVLQQQIIASQGEGSILRQAVGSDWKGKLSPLCYAFAIVWAFWSAWMAMGIYALVALMWLIPDRRIERAVRPSEDRPA
jgi:TMEM175 potassium channel family protein